MAEISREPLAESAGLRKQREQLERALEELDARLEAQEALAALRETLRDFEPGFMEWLIGKGVSDRLDIAEVRSRLSTALRAITQRIDAIEVRALEADMAWHREARFRFHKNLSGTPEARELLAERENFEALLASDIGALRDRAGVDLVRFLTVYEGARRRETPTSQSLAVGDTLVTNFGNNEAINAQIGAGDILPPTVLSVRIGDRVGVRISGNPDLDRKVFAALGVSQMPTAGKRPGYYDISSGNFAYLPIFHGMRIEIREMREIDEDDLRLYDERSRERADTLRMWDTMANGGEPLTDSQYDREIAERAKKLTAE